MIAVGDTSGNNTGWRLFGLNKANPSLYWHRPLSDHSSPWTQGNHGFADSPREMMSFSFGGSSQQFVFGVLTDGNYAVTHFPNGDWWKNWHADMGPQKPTPMTQLVTCASMNYALDAKGAVFSQTLWPPAVSQWVSNSTSLSVPSQHRQRPHEPGGMMVLTSFIASLDAARRTNRTARRCFEVIRMGIHHAGTALENAVQ